MLRVTALVVLAIFGCISADEGDDGKYMLMGTRKLMPGTPYELSVVIRDAPGDVRLHARITVQETYRSQVATLGSTDLTVSPDSYGVMSITIPAEMSRYYYQVFLNVAAQGGLSFNKTESLTVSSKRVSVLVQTDKATYKPSDIVHFRVVAVNQKLIPLSGPYDVVVYDQAKNRIAQYLDRTISGDAGFISGDIQLSEQPPLGRWVIEVTIPGLLTPEEKSFEVDEYVLPKFKVSIDFTRNYHVIEFGNLHGSVEAKYTFGEPVVGSAVLTIQSQRYIYPMYDDVMMDEARPGDMVRGAPGMSSQPRRPAETTRVLTATENGKYDFMVSMSELYRLAYPNSDTNDYEQLRGQSFTFTANITEELTGKIINVTSTMRIEYQRMAFEWLETTPSSFKPGMMFRAFLKVKQVNGAAPERLDLYHANATRRTVQMTRHYVVELPSEGDRSNMRQEFDTTSDYFIDDSGLVVAEIPLPTGTSSVRLQATYTTRNGDTINTSPYSKTITSYKSRSGDSIQLSMLNDEKVLKPDQENRFLINASFPLSRFTYYVILKDSVVQSAEIPVGGGATAHEFSFMIDETTAPTAKVAVMAITDDFEVLVDVNVLTVESDLPNKVTADFSEVETQPGQSIALDVEAAPNSFLGILAVDTSVELLRSGNDVLFENLLSEMSYYDGGGISYRSMMMPCYRCWWPYYPGGDDSTDALSNVGIFLITDSYIHQENSYNNGGYYFPEMDRRDGNVYAMMPEDAVRRGPAGADASDENMAPPVLDSGTAGEGGNEVALQEPVRVRTNFVETWLWTEETTG